VYTQPQIHPLEQHPNTLLSVAAAAPFLHKAQSTVQVDITRRPSSLPVITKIGRRTFFQVKDILEWLEAHRIASPKKALAK